MKIKKGKILYSILVFVGLIFGNSCDKPETTRSFDYDEFAVRTGDFVNTDDKSGISFEMESDSLYEEIEEVHFASEEWSEEELDVDL